MKNPQSFKLTQLKQKFTSLGLSSTGNKTELIARLVQMDPTGAWMESIDDDEIATTEEEGPNTSQASQSSNLNCEALLREIELLKRENAVMNRKLQITQRESEIQNSLQAASGSQPMRSTIDIRALADLVCAYDGNNPAFSQWENQITLVYSTFKLDNNTGKVLIASKLKGKALSWLHSCHEHIEMSFFELLDEMKVMFGSRTNVLTL